jgi:hypothetical protein
VTARSRNSSSTPEPASTTSSGIAVELWMKGMTRVRRIIA